MKWVWFETGKLVRQLSREQAECFYRELAPVNNMYSNII